MAYQSTEGKPFKLNMGVDGYGPDVTSDELTMERLSNIHPGFDRWTVPLGLEVKETLQEASPFSLWVNVVDLNDGWIYDYWNIYGKLEGDENLVFIAAVPTSSPVGEIDLTDELNAVTGHENFVGFVVLTQLESSGTTEIWNFSNGAMYEHEDSGNTASASTSGPVIGQYASVADAPILLKSDLTLPAGSGFGIELTFPPST